MIVVAVANPHSSHGGRLQFRIGHHVWQIFGMLAGYIVNVQIPSVGNSWTVFEIQTPVSGLVQPPGPVDEFYVLLRVQLDGIGNGNECFAEDAVGFGRRHTGKGSHNS